MLHRPTVDVVSTSIRRQLNVNTTPTLKQRQFNTCMTPMSVQRYFYTLGVYLLFCIYDVSFTLMLR